MFWQSAMFFLGHTVDRFSYIFDACVFCPFIWQFHVPKTSNASGCLNRSVQKITRLSRGGAADLARRLSCSEHWDLCWAVIWDFRSETTTILELAHKPNCSCIRDFVVCHVFLSWETIKRRSPIAGIVPECPDRSRFRFAWCQVHDYLLITYY